MEYSSRSSHQSDSQRERSSTLISGGRRWSIADFDSFDDDGLQNADAFESLWTVYYRAMCIEARRNPKLRRQFMPKKYWRDLPEVRAEC